ncbi:MAG: hypothetical protein KDB27_32040 [Planctomycetales bacterium]|nr:hypothetical protein [Planctomycetales bacterium]
MWFACYLHKKGIITGDQFAEAVREQLSRRPLLGAIAIQSGKLSVKQVMRVFTVQADDLEKAFGELAIELGFLTEEDLAQLLLEQANSAPQLSEILVETGALTREQMLDELAQYRSHAHGSNVPVSV